MFMHYSYRHIVMNVIFGIFIMYELEYCWRWSIIVSLLAGFAAHCIAMATMSGQLLGLSGALCGCLGIQFAALLLHCNYLRQVYGPQFYLIFVMSVMVLFMIIGFSQAGLIHFFGLCFGLLFGLALYPRMP
jgi:membrane associated rhomboid family serine protease